MIYIANFIYGFMCTVGFAVIFNSRKSSLVKAGLGGGIGWATHFIINHNFQSVVISTFVASLVIALLGEIFAVIDKQPATLYIIPGIVPLVPGFGLYYTMLSLLEQNYNSALQHGIETILIAILIAAALTIILSINTYRKQRR
ncbi:threonine/serine exporter family protein [Natranaerobius thermophilus]|uniref:Membrane spanning protein n=1 Tax=Natranaerobius thermophilus (strain ATCC BAA-1301 / DSM 18059 / JW/NM-WN-LF) TaxID=457570 RepID=B2A873_NATTJ|nr:threonine/serine exporter family protein [Natranaerobius thermophilus]ACB84439.1 membrane spanning protein [Natranaerobius thermophilus JW/NM-WN-LF]